VIPVYRSMLSLATIITPNCFEEESECRPSYFFAYMISTQDAVGDKTRKHRIAPSRSENPARDLFRAKHRHQLHPWLLAVLPSHIQPSHDGDSLLCLSSAIAGKDSKDGNISVVHAKCISTLPGYFVGVGDLAFRALRRITTNPRLLEISTGRREARHRR